MLRFVDPFPGCGLCEIEVLELVSRSGAATARRGFASIQRRSGVVHSALVPNERGLERAIACGVGKVSVFTARATFSRRNTNVASIAESRAAGRR